MTHLCLKLCKRIFFHYTLYDHLRSMEQFPLLLNLQMTQKRLILLKLLIKFNLQLYCGFYIG
jgi:hypothetical protein